MRAGSIAIILMSAAFAAYVLFSLWTFEPLQIVTSRLERGPAGISISGKVENRGSSASGPISIEVRYFDERGKQIAVDTVPIKSLEAGKLRGFSSSPARVAAAGYSLYLKHGTNPYGN
jgi:hypothetical protein